MEYQKINLSTWDRGELFAFYIEKMRIVMSLTVDVDVAPLAAFVHQNGLKFYPAMIWTVSRVINAHDFIRRAERAVTAGLLGIAAFAVDIQKHLFHRAPPAPIALICSCTSLKKRDR